MNLYAEVLFMAELKRRAKTVENEAIRAKLREQFLASVPREYGESNVHDLDDYR